MASACSLAQDDIYNIPQEPPRLESSESFYPWDRLLEYFQTNDRQQLHKILTCPCGRCTSDAKLFDEVSKPIEYIDQIIGTPGTRPDWARAAVSLLALFVSLGRPQLITPFLQQNLNDNHLEVLMGAEPPEIIAETYWPKYVQLNRRHSIIFASRFAKEIPRFAVPRLDSRQYIAWNADRILPFLKEEEIGSRSDLGHILPEGGNSRVFKFEIHDEYRRFKDNPDVRKFARKQIHASCARPPLLIISEKKALDLVGALSHPHIVKLIKTYRHGENYNMVFPFAKTNLDKYLRIPEYGAFEKRQGPIEASPLWEQLAGITEALGAIHSYGIEAEERGASGEEKHIGFHFDIKDANILIEEDDNWVISDFGQATFKSIEREGTTSNVLNQGGTDSYAPPEFNDDFKKLGRSFDIWSLGCVSLEVLAFVVRGYEGLSQQNGDRGLDEARKSTSQGRRREDHKFYTDGDSPGSWKVKPEIEDFMLDLRRHVDPQRQQSTSFFDRVIDLIRQMLSPVASDRPKAENVLRDLKAYLSEANMDPGQRLDSQAFSTLATQQEIAQETFAEMSQLGIHRRYGESEQRVYFRVMRSKEQDGGQIWIEHKTTRGDESIPLPRDSAMIPYWAFRKDPDYNGPLLCFNQLSRPWSGERRPFFEKVPRLEYFFSGREPFKQASVMQSIMTGQQLCGNFTVKEVILRELPSNLARKIRTGIALFFSNSETRSPQLSNIPFGKNANVQLWTEYKGHEGAIPRADHPLSRVRRNRAKDVHKEVPACRVVIYCKHSIILLRIAQNERINKKWTDRISDGIDPCLVEFVPTDKTRDPSFSALTINPPNPDDTKSYAAIPLSRDWLQELEEAKGWTDFNSITREYTSVKLVFETSSDREAFKTEYDKVKDVWRERRKN